jgi:hypothetical protein
MKKKTSPTTPQDTTGTPQRHATKTLRTHHQSATKTPTTTETQLRDHQDTSSTDTTNSRKDLQRVFPKSCYQHTLSSSSVSIAIFSHHHHLASPSSSSQQQQQPQPQQQHHHNHDGFTSIISCHQPCPYHQ